jgi:hypothetical protein
MLANALRERIEVWERTLTSGALGRDDTAWALTAIRWGRVVPLSVSNLAKFQQLGHSEMTDEVLVRGRFEFSIEATQFRVSTRSYQPLAPGRYDAKISSTAVLVKAL